MNEVKIPEGMDPRSLDQKRRGVVLQAKMDVRWLELFQWRNFNTKPSWAVNRLQEVSK